MCGLFGVIAKPGSQLNHQDIADLVEAGKLAQRRGSDASGLVLFGQTWIEIAKANQSFRNLLRTKDGEALIRHAQEETATAIFGHSRLETHGYSGSQTNNQPIVVGNWIVVHNGVITNEHSIRNSIATKADHIETDTTAIALLLDEWDENGRVTDLDTVFNRLRGEYSVIAASAKGDVLCRTNVGNLYTNVSSEGQTRVASEPRQLPKSSSIKQVDRDTTVWLRQISHQPIQITLGGSQTGTEGMEGAKGLHIRHEEVDTAFAAQMTKVASAALTHATSLRRCVHCVLPETFPGLEFGTDGVCSICREFTLPEYSGINSLEAELRDKSPDNRTVLACLSGGRDSCYVLHLLCELGFKPIAYTYDWGMVTTAARENMSRMCGDLGVEHIVVSPDIRRNRRRINQALRAWLKYPRAGTIPILMAGDKPYFRWAGIISKERGNIPAVMADHPLETTGFKSMLAGATATPSPDGGVAYRLSATSLAKMTISYFRHACKSPGLFPSLAKEGTRGFVDYYLGKHEFIRPFSFIPWNEQELENTLREKYDWSSDQKRSSTSWRMGDGTAPFYNLMYHIGLGMTEHDALRSNQIRFGLATRPAALEQLQKDNQLNILGLASYFATVDIDSQWAANRIEEYAQSKLPSLS